MNMSDPTRGLTGEGKSNLKEDIIFTTRTADNPLEDSEENTAFIYKL
jgi:hypothetical protein